jgi:hypothetical protein
MFDQNTKKVLLSLFLLSVLCIILLIYNIRKNSKKIINKKILLLDFTSGNIEQHLSHNNINYIKVKCNSNRFIDRIEILLNHIRNRYTFCDGIMIKTNTENMITLSSILEKFIHNTTKPIIVFNSYNYENLQKIRCTNINKVLLNTNDYLVEPRYFYKFHDKISNGFNINTMIGVYNQYELVFNQKSLNNVRIDNVDTRIKIITLNYKDDIEYILSHLYKNDQDKLPDGVILNLLDCKDLSDKSINILKWLKSNDVIIKILNNYSGKKYHNLGENIYDVNSDIIYSSLLHTLSVRY